MLKHLTYQPERDTTETQIIMFHGFGADSQDLYAIADILAPEMTWHFPNGLLEVPLGPGWTGRAWWTIDMNRISDKNYDFTKEVPSQLPECRKQVLAWFQKNKFDWSKTIVGGFSQGGMLALDLFLNAPVAPKGLMMFSSALINKQEQSGLIRQRQGLPFFLSHGTQDQVLPYRCGQQLETFLIQNGLKGKLVTFQGGHELPMDVLMKARSFISETEGA